VANSKSAFLRTQIYKAIHNQATFIAPTQLYMSLHVAAPGLTGANEVVGNAYARQPIAFGSDTGGSGTNNVTPIFPAPTPGNWGTLTHFGVWDSPSGGAFLAGDALLNAITTSIGISIAFPSGSITWTET
jgi:hypothetical protein